MTDQERVAYLAGKYGISEELADKYRGLLENSEWLKEHESVLRQTYQGQYLVVHGQQVVFAGKSEEGALQEAKQYAFPLIMGAGLPRMKGYACSPTAKLPK